MPRHSEDLARLIVRASKDEADRKRRSGGGRPGGPDPEERAVLVQKILAGILGAVVFLILVVTLLPDEPGEALPEPPPSLVGRWVTDDPRYQDRAMEFTEESLILHTGDGTNSFNGIQELRAQDGAGRTAITVSYHGPAGAGEITVFVPDANNNTLTMQNRPNVVWRRENPRQE